MVSVPAVIPVTIPEEAPTVARVLLLLHAPPVMVSPVEPTLVSVTDDPMQTDDGPLTVPAPADELTVMIFEAEIMPHAVVME